MADKPDDDVVPAHPDPEQPVDELIDQTLVEEVSIDGMCGVY